MILPEKTGREEPIGNRHDKPLNNNVNKKALWRRHLPHNSNCKWVWIYKINKLLKIKIKIKKCKIKFFTSSSSSPCGPT